MQNIHSVARSYAQIAQTYSQGRPSYPEQAQTWLQQSLGLKPGCTVVEVGAGTGKFTRLLCGTGAAVVAIEPVKPMLAKLVEAYPAVQAVVAEAQSIPLPSGFADAVVCAQSFHWFATQAALQEFMRLLKPGGLLGLIWNVRDESVDWVQKVTDIITPYEGDAPRFYKMTWQAVVERSPLQLVSYDRWAHQHEGPLEDVIIRRTMSVSFIAALPKPQQASILEQLKTLIATHPALQGRERIAMPYTTQAWVYRRPA